MTDDEIAGLKSCLRLLKNYRWKFLFLIISSLGVSLFEVGTMAILILAINLILDGGTSHVIRMVEPFGNQITDIVKTREEGLVFVLLVIVAVCLQIGKSGLQYCCAALGIRLGVLVTREFQSQITEKIMRLDYPTVATYPSGHLNSLLSISGTTPRLIVTNVLGHGLPCLCLFIFYVGLMLILSILLTLYALVTSMLVFLGLRGIVGQLKDLGGKQTMRTLDAGRITIDFLNLPRLMRLFNVQEEVKEVLYEARSKILETNQASSLLTARVDPGIQILTIAGVGIFLVGGYVLAGEAFNSMLPSLLVFLLILNRLMPQVRNLNAVRMTYANNRKSLEILGRFFSQGESKKSGLNLKTISETPSVLFDDVTLVYPNNKIPSVRDVTFELQRGKMVALVGPSGSGKTSIADLLTGLYEPTEGKILVDGVSLGDIDHREWVKRLGVVDQGVELLATTIRDNILFARSRFSDEDVLRAAKNASVDEFVGMLEKKYATYIGPKGFQLSGGQRQRIALARALLGEPPLLVLDEATSALDTKSERLINQTLRAWRKNHAILVIAHRLSSVIDADEILVLDSGKVIERGSFGDLMRADGAFVEAWNLQTSKSESE